jgi:hypothetical protein
MNGETGEIRVTRSLAHGQAEYLLSVEAKDTGSNFTATTKVCNTKLSRAKLYYITISTVADPEISKREGAVVARGSRAKLWWGLGTKPPEADEFLHDHI